MRNATSERKETYSVVVESGNCSMDYSRWEERCSCGHQHKTIEAAKRCLDRLTRWYCQHGRPAGSLCRHCTGGMARGENTSARWYNATIHNQDEERVAED
jgi:hypothetical protein